MTNRIRILPGRTKQILSVFCAMEPLNWLPHGALVVVETCEFVEGTPSQMDLTQAENMNIVRVRHDNPQL